jgi:anti-sigma regulatory factor (Ser/Thr protein kinase)
VDHGEELASLALPPEPASAGRARRLVTDALRDVVDDDLLAAALVITSELVTNAVLHARTDFEVAVRRDESGLRIEVQDGNPRLPRRKRYSDQSATGRGLVLVESLSAMAGAEQNERGKVVWAVLVAVPPAPGPARDGRSDAVDAVVSPLVTGVPAPVTVGDDVRVAASDGSPELRGVHRHLVDA